MSASPAETRPPRICVVGSVNVDMVVRTERLPLPGETVAGTDVRQIPGGKGANQAVAAARLGAQVTLVGRVGDDAFGRQMLAHLAAEQVDVSRLATTAGVPTGLAAIQVAASGQNSIVVVPGANGHLSPADLAAAADAIRAADLLLVQLETPLDAIGAAMRIARAAGVPILFDPAPASARLPDELLRVEFCCPNESEAATLVGRPVVTPEDARQAARALRDLGVGCALVTLGDRGVWVNDGRGLDELSPAVPVHAVDTTAAGDAFAAGFAVRFAQTGDVSAAVRWGSLAGALAATQFGAQPSLPTAARLFEAESPTDGRRAFPRT